jgi:zinc/manganese transport system permease protein
MLFYIIFALAVTASVQLVGVYLVFSSLIIPALATRNIKKQTTALALAYMVGAFGYLSGLLVSASLDLPSGAIIVWALVGTALCLKLFFNSRRPVNSK